MAAPNVRFATAADGQRVAYTEEGEGEPYVIVSTVGDVQLNREVSVVNGWADGLSPAHRVIFLDLRGTGLSPGQPSLDGWVRDIQAVFEAAQIGQAVLHGAWLGCAAAIAFAAREPDRVSQLILATPFTLGRDLVEEVPPATVSRLAEIDFPSWVETAVNLMGVPDADSAAMRAIFTRQGAEAMNTLLAFYPSLDLRAELARISTPTLVLAYSEGAMGLDIPLAVAAALDDARSVVLSHYWLHPEEDVEAIRGFLGEPSSSRTASSGTPSNVGSFRTILFTDVVASTPLLAQLKDAKMREVMRDHDAVLQGAVDEHGGRVVKEIGDAFMAEFRLPSAAVDCAIAMQRGVQTQFAHTDVPIRLRIGINAGEPIVEDDDLHGASVVIAKRLESAAPENGILVSEVVRQAVAGKDFEFADQGEVELKGFDEPVRAWSVAWDN